MAMVDVDSWQPVQADSQPKSSGLVLGRRPLGAVRHSSNEPGELSQWLCHDDSTINIVVKLLLLLLLLFPKSLFMSLQAVCWEAVYTMSQYMSRANIGIFVLLRMNAEWILMKFAVDSH